MSGANKTPRTRPTQEELARKLCDLLGRDKLSKQYINRLVNGLPPRHSEPPLNRRYSLHVPREESERQESPRQAQPSPPPELVLSVEEFREKLREKYYAERALAPETAGRLVWGGHKVGHNFF